MTFTPKFVDLVRNIAVVEGAGPVTLGPALSGFASLADAVDVDDQFYYCLQGVEKPIEREIGRGTTQADGRVARVPIAGTPTDFSSGAKTIALVAPAEWFEKIEALSGELDAPVPGALKARSAFEVETTLGVGEDAAVLGDLTVSGTTFAKGNLTVGGALNVTNPNTAFGPTSGIPSDCNFYIDNTNYNGFLNFRSWSAGAPQVDGWIRGRRGSGIELSGTAGVALLHDGTTIANVTNSALNLAAGKEIQVNGIKVVGARQGAIADDVSGATNQVTVNSILAALRNHGLIAP